MLIIIISRSSLKLGHVASKTRLLGQQATQVSDLGPLWPSCLKLLISQSKLSGTRKFSLKHQQFGLNSSFEILSVDYIKLEIFAVVYPSSQTG